MKKIAALLLLGVSLSACQHGVVHDVTWWEAHDSERKTELAQCNNDPGTYKNDPNCWNAGRALDNKMFDPNNHNSPNLAS